MQRIYIFTETKLRKLYEFGYNITAKNENLHHFLVKSENFRRFSVNLQ